MQTMTMGEEKEEEGVGAENGFGPVLGGGGRHMLGG